MIEEREIAGFALPLAAGVFAASLVFTGTDQFTCMASLLTSVSLVFFMPSDVFKRCTLPFQTTIVFISVFCTGIFIHQIAMHMEMISDPSLSSIKACAMDFCENLKMRIDMCGFQDDTVSLVKALMTGDRSGLDKNVTDAFRTSGASHILALSGMHIGIIYGILHKVMSAAGNNLYIKRARSVMITAACGFYTLATGAGESIMRAFIFILVNETCRLTFRKPTPSSTFFTALIIQVIIDPSAISSISFQLSYAAMAGIVYIYPFLRRFWPDEGNLNKGFVQKIWNTVGMSIACQMTTGPIAWHYFKTFPQYFILTNLISLPLTGMIIPLSILSVVLQSSGISPDIPVHIVEALTTFLISSLEIIADMQSF